MYMIVFLRKQCLIVVSEKLTFLNHLNKTIKLHKTFENWILKPRVFASS